jgi:predicted O-methyltransferase YrrM
MKPQFPEIGGWLYDHEFLALSQLARGKRVLEIGAFQGRSTVALAQSAEHIVSIDHFSGDEFTGNLGGNTLNREQVIENYARNTKPYKDKITVMISDMYKAIPLLDPKDFDLLFYDADHTAEAAKFFCDWALDARPDAIVALHDYKPGDPVWQPSVDVMDEWHTASGRMAKVIGSLFIAVNEQIPYGQHLGTEAYPDENQLLDANV